MLPATEDCSVMNEAGTSSASLISTLLLLLVIGCLEMGATTLPHPRDDVTSSLAQTS